MASTSAIKNEVVEDEVVVVPSEEQDVKPLRNTRAKQNDKETRLLTRELWRAVDLTAPYRTNEVLKKTLHVVHSQQGVNSILFEQNKRLQEQLVAERDRSQTAEFWMALETLRANDAEFRANFLYGTMMDLLGGNQASNNQQ